MASGPHHFQEAERLLTGTPLSDADREDGIGPKSGFWAPTQMELHAAQVHATLALAAASAMNIRRNGAVEDVDAAAEWERVLGGSS
jgi:hypothetical protein